eukprot:SAG31_NODE_13912_length_838_cov_1.041949_1_plen_54_part_00
MFPLGLEELADQKDLQYLIDVFVLDQDNAAAAKVRDAQLPLLWLRRTFPHPDV